MTAREASRDLVDAVFNAARLASIHRDPRYAALRAIALDMAPTQPAPDAQPQTLFAPKAGTAKPFWMKWADGTVTRYATSDERNEASRKYYRDMRAVHATVDAAEARA